MSKTRTAYPADTVELTAPGGGVVAGTAILIGSIFGVPIETKAATEAFQLETKGIFEIPKTAAITFAEGDLAQWDVSAGSITDVVATNFEVGTIQRVAAAGDATVAVKISGHTVPAVGV